MSLQIGGLGRWGVVLGLSAGLVVGAGVIAADDGHGRVVLVAQKTQKKKPAAKKGDDSMAKDDAGMAPAPAAKGAATAPPAEGSLSFKRDIAPILVANCLGCHSANGQGIRRSKLDMSTFDKLMAGGQRGKDIVGGDADGSMLVQMIMGQETPKMPPNNGQRGFSEDAAEKIVTWVKQGARLDAGVSSTDPINKYAATLEDLRGAELAKLSPEERDKIAEAAGRERWKKASKLEPETTTTKGGHFLLLSTLPKERATKLLQAMEAQYKHANTLLSTGKTPVLNPTEKIGLYVFKEQAPFVEFVRSVENADVESGEQARAKLAIESPYIVAVDPAAGGEEASAASSRKGARGKKKAEESAGGPDRTLAGILTEQLVAGAANKAGKPPKWVSLGLGAFMASHLEPRSPYYLALRKETAESFRIGWQAKANGALGGEEKTETIRAIGFSLFEWLSASVPPQTLAAFVQTMLDGQGKTDDAIGNCLSGTRQEFLDNSGLWISEKYGR
jgi:mono/diheme cytochrome c family protein